jgi:hypothetical protein
MQENTKTSFRCYDSHPFLHLFHDISMRNIRIICRELIVKYRCCSLRVSGVIRGHLSGRRDAVFSPLSSDIFLIGILVALRNVTEEEAVNDEDEIDDGDIDDEDSELDLVSSLNSSLIGDYDDDLCDYLDLLIEKNENDFMMISLMMMFLMIMVLDDLDTGLGEIVATKEEKVDSLNGG